MRYTSLPVCLLALLAGCATHSPDYFHVLNVQPAGDSAPQSAFHAQLMLHITLPSMVDRSEFVVLEGEKAHVIDHQRWASPLIDQLTTVLGQDIEARRPDILVSDRHLDQPDGRRIKVSIDIAQMSFRQGKSVSFAARWRVIDTASGKDTLGREVMTSTVPGNDYGSLAKALSSCVAQLADRLVREMPAY